MGRLSGRTPSELFGLTSSSPVWPIAADWVLDGGGCPVTAAAMRGGLYQPGPLVSGSVADGEGHGDGGGSGGGFASGHGDGGGNGHGAGVADGDGHGDGYGHAYRGALERDFNNGREEGGS